MWHVCTMNKTTLPILTFPVLHHDLKMNLVPTIFPTLDTWGLSFGLNQGFQSQEFLQKNNSVRKHVFRMGSWWSLSYNVKGLTGDTRNYSKGERMMPTLGPNHKLSGMVELLFHLSFLTNMLLLLFVSRFLCLWVAFCVALADETFDTKNEVYDFFLGRLTVALVSPGLEIEPPYMWRSLGLSALGLLKKKHEVNT